MDDRFQWSERTLGFRSQLPPGAADAIGSAGAQVSADAGVEDVVAALRALGLGFMTAIIGVMAIRDVSLADAKQLVHHCAAFASTREERVVDIMGGDACCGHGIWMNPLTGGPLRCVRCPQGLESAAP